MLLASGELKLDCGEQPAELLDAMNLRRTVYALVDRQFLPGAFRTFDFANPATPMGKRYETTVPQQALFLMNSPLVIQQVRRVVQRDEFKSQPSMADRIRYLYELFYQRLPSEEEIHLGQKFVAFAFAVADGLVERVFIIANPDKMVAFESAPIR